MNELSSLLMVLKGKFKIILLGLVTILLFTSHFHSIASAGFENIGSIYLNKAQVNQTFFLPSAEYSFKQAIQWDASNVHAHRNLGVLYIIDEKWIDAASQLETGLDFRPDDILMHYYLAMVFGEWGQREDRLHELRLARAWQLLRESHTKKGLDYLNEEEFTQAELEFRSLIDIALKLKDKYWIAQGNQFLGWSLENQRNWDEAINAYQAAINVGLGQIPEARAMMDLACLYDQMEKFSQSSDLINQAIELHPHNRYLLLAAGDIYKSRSECVIAIEYFQLATHENPLDGLPWEKIAECYIELGKFHEVVQATNNGLEQQMQYAALYHLRAKAYMNLGDRIQACKDLQKALSISPEEMGLRQDLIDANCIMERE